MTWIFDKRVFITNGHGMTHVPTAVAYFYLIAEDIAGLEIDKDFQDGKSKLYRRAASSDAIAFSVIDLTASTKLHENLSGTETGKQLLARILHEAPCIVRSDIELVSVKDAQLPLILPLRNMDQDFQNPTAEMFKIATGERANLVKALRFVDENFKLEPGLLGVKLQGNNILKRIIDRLEGR